MRNFVSFLFLFGAASTAGFGAAQHGSFQSRDIRPLDIEAIRAASETQMDEARALAEHIRARSESLRGDARQTQLNARSNHERYTKTANPKDQKTKDAVFDFDRMIADHAKMAEAGMGDAPRFIAFASLSMPQESLKVLVRDVSAAGGVTVLRGFPGGSAKTLTQILSKMASNGAELSSLGIDPRLFRAFNIKAAPSFVMASSDFTLCDGLDCTNTLPPHDRMSGNVSVEFALETFASGAGPGSRIAALHLARLKRSVEQ